MNTNNKKLIRIMAIFLGVVIFLTFFSRTIFHFNLPIVTAKLPAGGRVVNTIEGNSRIIYSNTNNIYAQTQGRVKEIFIKPGDEVRSGQKLMEIEPDIDKIAEVKGNIEKKEQDIKLNLMRLNNLQSATSSNSIERDINRNQELTIRDERRIKEIQDKIDLLNKEVNDIKNTVVDPIRKAQHEHNISIARDKLDTTQALYNEGIQTRQALSEAENSLRQQEIQLEIFIQAEMNEKRSSIQKIENDIKGLNDEIKTINNTMRERHDELNDKIYNFERKKIEENINNDIEMTKLNFSINSARIDIAAHQRELERLNNTNITSRTNGVISDINVSVGNRINDGDLLAKALDTHSQYKIELLVDMEKLDLITPESTIEINVRGIQEMLTGNILSINPDEDNDRQYKISILIQGQEHQLNRRNASVKIITESPIYDTIIPNSALRRDRDGHYVLVLREKDGLLGKSYVAHRVNVRLIDSDNSLAAIEGLRINEPIIVSSTGVLTNGSRVRYEE